MPEMSVDSSSKRKCWIGLVGGVDQRMAQLLNQNRVGARSQKVWRSWCDVASLTGRRAI